MAPKMSDSSTIAMGAAVAAGIAAAYALVQRSRAAAAEAEVQHLKAAAKYASHWNMKFGDRRGLGDAIVKVNHIALIVADVGRSAAFYVDVLGLQQVRRPNFDRHGAWFTMGNCELHLIKGNPVVHSGNDLIVSHISLEIDPELIESGAIAERLTALGVHWRQNISVPDPQKSRAQKFEDTNDQPAGSEAKPTTGVVQYFLRDPDGHYIEICNCDRLTAFCMGEDEHPHLDTYNDGVMSLRKCFTVGRVACRWRRASKARAAADEQHILHHDVPFADEVDPEKLLNLMRRRNTYGDVTQGHTQDEIEHALKEANNDVAIALALLKAAAGEHQKFQPPAWIEDGVVTKARSIEAPRVGRGGA